MGKKNVAKSVRMTDEVFNYVDSFEGNGFNEKFENLVLTMFKTENELKRRISEHEALLRRLHSEYMEKRKILDKISSVQYNIDCILRIFPDCSSK